MQPPLWVDRFRRCVTSGAAMALLVTGTLAEQGWKDVTVARGLDFVHHYYGDGTKHMPENMGAGVALLDYDGDGDLDLYLVQGAPVIGEPPAEAVNRLFRQEGDGSFLDVTGPAGVGDPGVGMGVAVGDFDDDGWPDLYVTNFGPNSLLRNRGDGSFVTVAGEGAPTGAGWSTGAAFVDFDADADLDLFVARYLDYDPESGVFCGNAQTRLRAYCHPDLYPGQPDVAWRNEGDGRWTAVGADIGVLATREGRGLGVLAADLDADGVLDLYVANDTTANHLYSVGSGRLSEGALLAGVAVNGDGEGEASMGVATGDLDGDGADELFVTHLDEETNTLYRQSGRGLYGDATDASGLAAPSRPWVGFGTAMADFDLDGDLDVVVANGHIIDNIALFDPVLSHAQPLQLFLNDGRGSFRPAVMPVEPLVGRGLATGDLDRDGDADLVVTQNGGRALVLENALGDASSSLVVVVPRPRVADWGSEWSVAGGGQVRRLHRPPSYLSQGAPEVILATAASERIAIEGRWLDGRRVRWRKLPAGRRYAVR